MWWQRGVLVVKMWWLAAFFELLKKCHFVELICCLYPGELLSAGSACGEVAPCLRVSL
jgi:hypothetical protein